MKTNKIYHLSHNDLDGYGSQFIVEKTGASVVFENTNYGAEITEKMNKLLAAYDSVGGEAMFLITDVNLTAEQAEYIESEVKRRPGLTLQLLDHHITGKPQAEKHDWYFLDEKICATKITYKFFESQLSSNEEYFAEIVNAYDLWQENDPLFQKGKLLNFQIFENFKFPTELMDEKRDLIFHLIESCLGEILIGSSIMEIDLKVPYFRMSFLKGKIPENIYEDSSVLLADKFNYFCYLKFKEMSQPVVELSGVRLKVFFDIDGGVFQNVSSFYNKENDGTFDACINISKKGVVGLRSKGNEECKNVAALAKSKFNGGGHFNASGGSLPEGVVPTKENIIEILKSL